MCASTTRRRIKYNVFAENCEQIVVGCAVELGRRAYKNHAGKMS